VNIEVNDQSFGHPEEVKKLVVHIVEDKVDTEITALDTKPNKIDS